MDGNLGYYVAQICATHALCLGVSGHTAKRFVNSWVNECFKGVGRPGGIVLGAQ